jgi:hypothetical protein
MFVSTVDREPTGNIPEPSAFVVEGLFDDDGILVGEARTYENPKQLTALQWAKTLEDHILRDPVSVTLVTDNDFILITRSAMLELAKKDCHTRIDQLMRYAQRASDSCAVILTSNLTPESFLNLMSAEFSS